MYHTSEQKTAVRRGFCYFALRALVGDFFGSAFFLRPSTNFWSTKKLKTVADGWAPTDSQWLIRSFFNSTVPAFGL